LSFYKNKMDICVIDPKHMCNRTLKHV
jgi:hypothetical protein